MRRLPSSVRRPSSIVRPVVISRKLSKMDHYGTLLESWHRRLYCRIHIRPHMLPGDILVLNKNCWNINTASCSTWRRATSVVNWARPQPVLFIEVLLPVLVDHSRRPLWRRRQSRYFLLISCSLLPVQRRYINKQFTHDVSLTWPQLSFEISKLSLERLNVSYVYQYLICNNFRTCNNKLSNVVFLTRKMRAYAFLRPHNFPAVRVHSTFLLTDTERSRTMSLLY